MNDHPAEETAETKASVYPGLGYPNHRDESPIEPIGWHGLGEAEMVINVGVSGLGEAETDNVSRETIDNESDG